nr:DUF2971 domain-containing protein [uncultured Carboxylicivirga sp.]
MFKYYNIPDKEVLNKIIGGTPSIKFSSAFDLNDPFELKFNIEMDPDEAGRKEEFFKVHPSANDADFKDWKEQVKDNEGFLWYQEQNTRNTIAQSITLCSFTTNESNSLMWSHYTNNHKGICVEYSEGFIDYLMSLPNFLGTAPVEYSELPPTINSLKDKKCIIEKMMFNKQLEWKYEQEHRVVIWSKNDVDYIPIETKYIKAIYIGSKAESDIVNEALRLSKLYDFDVYYGITIGKTYKVTFQKEKEGTIFTRTFWE